MSKPFVLSSPNQTRLSTTVGSPNGTVSSLTGVNAQQDQINITSTREILYYKKEKQNHLVFATFTAYYVKIRHLISLYGI
jgi:hypothetical protein